MPLAANTTGEHSTLAVLAGLAIIVWALGAIIALTGWLVQTTHRQVQKRRFRARAANGGAPAPVSSAASNRPPVPAPPPAAQARTANPVPRDGASAVKTAPNVAPPAIRGTRLSPETLEPLGEDLDAARLLGIAEARVAKALEVLPRDRWYVERYVYINPHRIPFVVVGETGVFALWGYAGPPRWDELRLPGEVAAHVKARLPGYAWDVKAGVCRTLANHEIKPRWWCRPGEPGAWVMGREWLIPWIEHFGPEHGLGVKDIERLRALANPRRDSPPPRVPEAVPDDSWVTPPSVGDSG